MGDQLNEWLRYLADYPPLQAMAAAIGTFILEDPTTIISGLLVAEGHMTFLTALIGVGGGIALGDFGLYLVGRWLGPRVVRWGLVTPHHLDKAEDWFGKNLVSAIVLSRFVPGSRLPTYLAAGVCRAHAWKFLAAAIVASLVWTLLLLTLTLQVGRAVLPLLGRYRWPLAIAAIAAFGLLQRRAMRRTSANAKDPEPPPVSFFEFWPPVIFYAPVVIYCMFLSVRYRGLMLPMLSNPLIYTGGMIRESKDQILNLVPEETRSWFAPHIGIDRDAALDAEQQTALALDMLAAKGIALPVVAKPDCGQRGDGVRPIRTEDDLRAYMGSFPHGHRLVLQEMVPYDNEMGVLWYRIPSETKGRVFSITHKVFPEVVGDGERTLREFILADPRARILQRVYLKRHAAIADDVLAAGERFRLVFAGNHKQGTIFRDGNHLLTPEIEKRFDEIGNSIPELYFARFDLRYRDLESMQRGEGFSIVEINGSGAEASHIWDSRTTLMEAYWTLFEQFRILYIIGRENRSRGFTTVGPLELIRELRDYIRTAENYPLAH